MAPRAACCGIWVLALLIGGCSQKSELAIPAPSFAKATTSPFSPILGPIGGVPDGVQITFVGDHVAVHGKNFSADLKAFFGLNNQLARRPNSLLTSDRHLLPAEPFVYTDPVTSEETTLEVEVGVEVSSDTLVTLTVPPNVACSAAFTNPIVRLYGQDGSSIPVTDVFHIVGPRCVALAPKRGVDIGGFTVTVHGEFFSPHTQVAIRYEDPATGATVVKGDTAATDITELFIDRNTMVIPTFPGVVPNSTLGLAEPLDADLLLFENIEEITGSIVLEPTLDGVPPCDVLRPESSEAPLSETGVRNSEFNDKFTFLPTGVTDFPSIAGILPESGPEIGGNTVVIHGDQFDAFSADLADPANPGIGIECPPDSGFYQAPLEAILVDRQTLVIKMPSCPVEIPEKVNFCIRNKYSMDHPGEVPSAGPGNDCVVFEDVYTYLPIPPIAPPIVTAIFPAGEGDQPLGSGHDYGLERLMVVGDWFDPDTTLNGGFEFLLPSLVGATDPVVVQAQRVILHNRNLIEVFTRRLPDDYYPLTADMLAGVRARNSVGHADFADAMVFEATPDAGATPVFAELCGTIGPPTGGNEVLIFGENFDTTTTVQFGGSTATDVQFITSGLLVATVPSGTGDAAVRVVDDGEFSADSFTYTYSATAPKSCPVLGYLDPDRGSHAGGYTVLAYGGSLTPTTRVEFGEGSGNHSQDIFYVSGNLLRVEVPEAFPEQIGATVGVGATDPLGGCDDIVKTVDFTFTAAQQAAPQILFVDTTVEVPATPTDFPAVRLAGGDRMLVIGSGFDQTTTFDIEKPQGSGDASETTSVTVLTPNLAVMTAPASPDGLPGLADLQAHNAFGDSDEFTVEYVQPGPPGILDVRNLDDGTQSAPIDAGDRLLIFGENFFSPVTVRLTGCDLNNQTSTITVTLTAPDVTLLEDHLIGVNVPTNTFCEGPLGIEVETEFGTATFEEEGEPIFQLIGPQPPIVEGVFEQVIFSSGDIEVVFFGRYFTPTTEFFVKTTETTFKDVLSPRIVSETVALVTMPPLNGGPPPEGLSGTVRAEEMDATLRSKINGDPYTEQTGLFHVITDDAPMLVGIHPDHGAITGGEQVLLLGDHFQKATGETNVTDIRFFDPALSDDVGDYSEASPTDLPLTPADAGKYFILNDHTILLITEPHDRISPEDETAPMTVIVESDNGNSQLVGGYTYQNPPAVLTPFLLSITPNETRLNGGTSHLISGGFLTDADRIVLTRTAPAASLTIPVDTTVPPTEGGHFAEVNDSFLVFVMPDLQATFAAGDTLNIYAEKDVGSETLVSNTLPTLLRVTFAGPPTITPDLDPITGSAFGGEAVTITGTLFTSNSQVLFGTMPARYIVQVSATELIAITPILPVDVPNPGIDLHNIHTEDGTVDVAVFTPGGWAVLEDGFTFEPAAPVVDTCSLDEIGEGQTAQVTVTGANFVPGTTTVTPSEAGASVTNLIVDEFDRLTFTYTAPTYAAGTLGPVTDSLTIATNQGTASTTCDITVHLAPFIDGSETSFTPSNAAPTTGVDPDTLTFVVVTVDGGNFLEGGMLGVLTRTATSPSWLEEIDPGDGFSTFGQFRVADSETIEFTAPKVFSSQVPTIIDGNPNIGAVDIVYVSPLGQAASQDGAFSYVPVFIDFQEFSFTLPGVASAPNVVPSAITLGDINADGVPDAAILGRNDHVAWMFLSNTFGAGIDINGDGVTPDFDGSFTRIALDDADLETFIVLMGPPNLSKEIGLANLDDDDELELLIPGSNNAGNGPARVMIVDMDSSGVVSQTLWDPGVSNSTEVRALTVGDFDGDDRDDFAFIVDSKNSSSRRLGIATSPTTAFVFSTVLAPLPSVMNDFGTSKLAAGDWDGDGDDDLIYASHLEFGTGFNGRVEDGEIIVVEIDSSGPSIVSQSVLTNLKAVAVQDILAANLDDDDADEAILVVKDWAKGSLFGDSERRSGGFAIIDDAISSLTANSYTVTEFGNVFGAIGDFNADGSADLALSRAEGEFTVWFGDGERGFVDSARAWTLDSALPADLKGGIAATDMNGDKMDELFMSDGGVQPVNVVLWLNASR
ncbi:MAG: IPT/TIG domain-containing protein [Planctomycetota bacterium]|jgi:hypothetical protein